MRLFKPKEAEDGRNKAASSTNADKASKLQKAAQLKSSRHPAGFLSLRMATNVEWRHLQSVLRNPRGKPDAVLPTHIFHPCGNHPVPSNYVEILETPVGDVDQGHRLAQEVCDTGSGKRVKMPSKSEAAKQIAVLAGWNEGEKIKVEVGPRDTLLEFLERIRQPGIPKLTPEQLEQEKRLSGMPKLTPKPLEEEKGLPGIPKLTAEQLEYEMQRIA